MTNLGFGLEALGSGIIIICVVRLLMTLAQLRRAHQPRGMRNAGPDCLYFDHDEEDEFEYLRRWN
jgi:hypothetical protein